MRMQWQDFSNNLIRANNKDFSRITMCVKQDFSLVTIRVRNFDFDFALISHKFTDKIIHYQLKSNYMKTKLFFLLLSTVSLLAESQVEKTEKIYRANNIYLSCITMLNEEGHIEGQMYSLGAKDERYSHILELFLLEFGSKQHVLDFLNQLKTFYENNDVGTSTKVMEHSVSCVNVFGKKLFVYDKDSRAFHSTNEKKLKKVIKVLEEFTSENS